MNEYFGQFLKISFRLVSGQVNRVQAFDFWSHIWKYRLNIYIYTHIYMHAFRKDLGNVCSSLTTRYTKISCDVITTMA